MVITLQERDWHDKKKVGNWSAINSCNVLYSMMVFYEYD